LNRVKVGEARAGGACCTASPVDLEFAVLEREQVAAGIFCYFSLFSLVYYKIYINKGINPINHKTI
jgi:hypothetical protein